MNETPVIKWIPIIPANGEVDKVKEKELVNKFVDKLMEEGLCELNFVDDNGESLILTYRYAENPVIKNQFPQKSYKDTSQNNNAELQRILMHRFGINVGFTSEFALDLIETKNNVQNHVSHRDYRLRNFPIVKHGVKGKHEANGNMLSDRILLPEFKDDKYRETLEKADRSLNKNGIEIAKKYQVKKIGKLFMAVSFEIMQRLEVTEIDLKARVSDEFMLIVKQYGYTAVNNRIQLADIQKTNYRESITPFIKK